MQQGIWACGFRLPAVSTLEFSENIRPIVKILNKTEEKQSKIMTVDVYGTIGSAPSRIVFMTCNMIGLDYNHKEIDLLKGDNLSPEYLKINPMHNIPAVRDGDFIINESRAAAAYLVEKYAKDDKLYPKDPTAKAVVNQRLYFEMGTFFKAVGDIMYPLMLPAYYSNQPGDKEYTRFKEVMGWVNDFVTPTGYAAGGDHATLADLAFMATYSSMEATGHFDLAAYPEAKAWFNKMKAEIPNYEKANGEGARFLGDFFKSAVKND